MHNVKPGESSGVFGQGSHLMIQGVEAWFSCHRHSKPLVGNTNIWTYDIWLWIYDYEYMIMNIWLWIYDYEYMMNIW
jgi:hypothetical protein